MSVNKSKNILCKWTGSDEEFLTLINEYAVSKWGFEEGKIFSYITVSDEDVIRFEIPVENGCLDICLYVHNSVDDVKDFFPSDFYDTEVRTIGVLYSPSKIKELRKKLGF